MFFRDVPYQPFDEFHDRHTLRHQDIILMTVVVESHEVTVIGIDTGGGDHRSSQISADVFNDDFRVAYVGLGIDIETVLVVAVDRRLDLFKGIAETAVQLIKKSRLKGVP